MALDVSNIVNVTASLRPSASVERALGRTLFLTTDTTLSSTSPGKVREFASLNEVGDVFGSTTEPYKAAQAYFAQSPYPKNFLVGRVLSSNQAHRLTGGALDVGVFGSAVSDGKITWKSTAADTITVPNLAGAAAAVQAALRGTSNTDLDAVTVSLTNNRFVVEWPHTVEIEATDLFVDSSGGGTDLAELMALRADDGAVMSVGGGAQSIAAALNEIEDENDSFYFVTAESGMSGTSTMDDISAWVGANPKLYIAGSAESGALTASEAATRIAILSAAESPRTAAIWSATEDYKDVSLAARFSSVDFTQTNALITAKFKSLPGRTVDDLTTSQAAELTRKRINYYSKYGDVSMVAEGHTFGPNGWIDERYWLDWFVQAVRAGVFVLLRSSPAIPQTVAGVGAVKAAVESVCRKGVRNGGLAPGKVDSSLAADIRSTFADPSFDGFLSTGYMVHAGSVYSQSASDRAARKSPPIKVFAKGSGAIHSANISIVFES